ncbi:proline/serine-rich coiled-coil protein 1 [Dermochelys coriacea]|uniref:proline/serine-rich coiled-coil protein 1 n=1 Tax=Dermochelys coriacea TaxID=27794 RepID=UPI0018E78289|nr:proline/serine-rich coiled-coil protein 1 [Dermochelys coriacea]
MEIAEEEDIKFITDEKFDFGLSSPSDSRDEEVRYVERGVAQGLDLNVQQREDVGQSREYLVRWSPLSAEKLEEIVKEANQLAVQLERCSLWEKENARAGLLGDTALGPAGESLVSVRFLHKEQASPRSPRRETFVVKNSPVRALLPTVEPGTLPPAGKSPSPCARAAPTPPRLRHKLGSCSSGGEWLRKKSTPSKGPALSPTKSTEKLSLQDRPPSRASPARGRREPMGPRSSPSQPRPAQEPLTPLRRAELLQEASAGRAKAFRGDAPQLSASARPAPGAHAHQTQARNMATPVPMSRRPVPSGIPKLASRIVVLSRAAVPGRPSQLQPMGRGSAGRRVLPSAAGQRGPGPQRTAPPGSRLQPPRKVTLPRSPR